MYNRDKMKALAEVMRDLVEAELKAIEPIMHRNTGNNTALAEKAQQRFDVDDQLSRALTYWLNRQT